MQTCQWVFYSFQCNHFAQRLNTISQSKQLNLYFPKPTLERASIRGVSPLAAWQFISPSPLTSSFIVSELAFSTNLSKKVFNFLSRSFCPPSSAGWRRKFDSIERQIHFQLTNKYRIYSNKQPGRLLVFRLLGWVHIRGWMLIKFSPFSAIHFQYVYFPLTKQRRKNTALLTTCQVLHFISFFLGGGGGKGAWC